MTQNAAKPNWDEIIEVIQRSYKIETHLDFFKWHQEYVNPLFQHDMMIAVWGDFDTGKLQYDVCSKENGVRTQTLLDDSKNINSFFNYLYKNWVNNEKRWYRINDFFSIIDEEDLPTVFTNTLDNMNSIVVYGLNDIRGNNDCIYIFLDARSDFPVPNLLLGMLMPHLDSALRRIKSFESFYPNESEKEAYFSQGLTEREHEILHWVKLGKTNTEISSILNISLNTVKNHLKRIFAKLDVSTRAHAVATYVPPQINE